MPQGKGNSKTWIKTAVSRKEVKVRFVGLEAVHGLIIYYRYLCYRYFLIDVWRVWLPARVCERTITTAVAATNGTSLWSLYLELIWRPVISVIKFSTELFFLNIEHDIEHIASKSWIEIGYYVGQIKVDECRKESWSDLAQSLSAQSPGPSTHWQDSDWDLP